MRMPRTVPGAEGRAAFEKWGRDNGVTVIEEELQRRKGHQEK